MAKRSGGDLALDSVDILLRERRYPEALGRLRDIDPALLSDPEAAGRYYIQLTHARIYSDQQDPYDDSEIRAALDALRYNVRSPMFAQCKLFLGLLQFKRGEFTEAIESLTEANVLFRGASDRESMARALNLMGCASMEKGQFSSGLQALVEAHSLFNEVSDGKGALDVFHNLTNYCLKFGRISEAYLRFKDYETELSASGIKSSFQFSANMAWLLGIRGEFEAARKFLTKAFDCIEGDARNSAYYWQTAGKLAEAEADYDHALENYTLGLNIAEEIDSDLRWGLRRHKADILVRLGRVDEAEEHIGEAQSSAEAGRDRTEVAACNRTLGMIGASRGLDQVARRYFKKALDLFEGIDSRWEMAQTRLLAAEMVSGLTEQEKADLEKAAHQYLDDEGLPLTQVKKV
ncbi:MAG: hypothetical protein JSU65_13475 [Candidatus Zixiibacteriota bacterium]|nr:MAG: hypothetical protein JSU65_13475 [candidate division Zixibacteria bacterium]